MKRQVRGENPNDAGVKRLEAKHQKKKGPIGKKPHAPGMSSHKEKGY